MTSTLHAVSSSDTLIQYHPTMPIPDYRSLMLPVLKLASKREIQAREATDRLAEQLGLTPEERAIVLASF